MAITYRPCSKYLPVCVRWVSAITSPFCSTITSRTLLPPTTPTPPSTPLSQSQSQYSLPYTATSKVLVTLSTIPQTVPTKSLTSPAPSTTPPPPPYASHFLHPQKRTYVASQNAGPGISTSSGTCYHQMELALIAAPVEKLLPVRTE